MVRRAPLKNTYLIADAITPDIVPIVYRFHRVAVVVIAVAVTPVIALSLFTASNARTGQRLVLFYPDGLCDVLRGVAVGWSVGRP